MHRLWLLVPLLVACGPDPSSYSARYLEVWCEVYEDQCSAGLIPDVCRPDTLPNEIDPEAPLADCVYDTFAAAQCLSISAWSCDSSGESPTVIPPDVCEVVWNCDGI